MTTVRGSDERAKIFGRARGEVFKAGNESELRSRCVWVSRAPSTEKDEQFRYYFVLTGTELVGDSNKDIAETIERSDWIKLKSMKLIDELTADNSLLEAFYILNIRDQKLLMIGISDTELDSSNPHLRDFVDTQIALDELHDSIPTSRERED